MTTGGGQSQSEEPRPSAPDAVVVAAANGTSHAEDAGPGGIVHEAAVAKKKTTKAKRAKPKPRAKAARKPTRGGITCRACGEPVTDTLIDLGLSPLRDDYHTADELVRPEIFYPLNALVCSNCFLVQLKTALPAAELARSRTLRLTVGARRPHDNRRFCRTLAKRLRLGPSSLAIEIANEEGGFLQHLNELSIPVLRIEPVEQLAHRSIERGLPTRVEEFGERTAKELASRGRLADVIFASNVVAQADNLRDVIAGLVALLKPRGIVILEFPYLQRLIADNQIDAIQHEFVSYLSLGTLDRLVASYRLKITDVQELPGATPSLRVLLTHSASTRPLNNSVAQVLGRERKGGLCDLETYTAFSERIRSLKRRLLSFLISTKSSGQTICCYGTRGCGNSLLHHFGIGPDYIDFVIDADRLNDGKYTPGLRIPVVSEDMLRSIKPDFLFVLPCLTLTDVAGQAALAREWGGKIIFSSPDFSVVDARSMER